jgi:hypothetical protein
MRSNLFSDATDPMVQPLTGAWLALVAAKITAAGSGTRVVGDCLNVCDRAGWLLAIRAGSGTSTAGEEPRWLITVRSLPGGAAGGPPFGLLEIVDTGVRAELGDPSVLAAAVDRCCALLPGGSSGGRRSPNEAPARRAVQR